MTKLRTANTFPWAMTRVAGVIGWPEVCRITHLADRTVRLMSEEDRDSRPRIDDALALDAAYRKAGGEGAPFLDAFAFQLDIAIDRQDACRQQLCDEVATSSREFGEAMAAALAVSNDPTASPLTVHRAVAEVAQAADALTAVQRRLASFLPSSLSVEAEKSGSTGA